MKTVRFQLQKLMGEKAQREHRRITLRTVADETKIIRHTVYAMDKGSIKTIPVEALIRLCLFFDCQPGDLLTLEDTPDLPTPPAE